MTVYGVEALRRVPGGIASREIAGGAEGGSEREFGETGPASGSEDTGVSGIVPGMSDTPEQVPPGVHEHRRAVAPEDIDELGHVNNLRYLEWMMAAAIEHSGAVGWDAARYAAAGNAWVVRSHAIEYLRPAFAGDAVVVRTWVSEMAKVSSRRKYAIAREGGPLLARAETLWVYINRRTHTLDRVPAPRLFAWLDGIERDFGRRAGGQRWTSRVLDLDIVLWSGGPWSSPGLTIPHIAFRERGFVLRPALPIAATWRDPLTGLSLRALYSRLTRPRPLPIARPTRALSSVGRATDF